MKRQSQVLDFSTSEEDLALSTSLSTVKVPSFVVPAEKEDEDETGLGTDSPIIGGPGKMTVQAKKQNEFIEEVRKNQRRATVTMGKPVQQDIWAQGFPEFFDSGKFSDLVLECCGVKFDVHRLILAFSSEFFASALKTTTGNVFVLDIEDADNVFPIALRFMYTGSIVITAENAVPLLAIADRFVMRGLKKEISSYISKNVMRENAVTLLKKALQLNADKIVKRCIHVVASNFAFVYNTTYEFLPFALFFQLISHEKLNVLREFEVYSHARRYVLAHKELSGEQKEELLKCVRYCLLTIDELLEVMQDKLVPQQILLEATLFRLERHETGNQIPNSELPLRLQQRPLYPILIPYKAAQKGIAPGILDWIGRDGGRRSWENPQVSSSVAISTSGLCRGALADLINKEENELWSKDVPASWFCIDFGPGRAVIPSHYCLRHGGNYRADSLRNWDLQGSRDGQTWEVIMSHRHDPALQGPFAIGQWEIASQQHHENISRAYRFFRVLQTGHNSSSRNFLVLSNIEIYGKLFEKPV